MSDEKLKQDVTAIVDTIFMQKEQEEQKMAAELALNESAKCVEELTKSLETKNTELSDMVVKLSESNGEVATLKTELEAAQKECAEVKDKLAEVTKVIEDMEKDKLADVRMASLEEAGVIGSDKEVIKAKVRDMSEEDFESFKKERIDLKECVLAHIEASKQDVEDKKGKENTEDVEADKATVTDPAEVNTDKVEIAAINTPGKADTVESVYATLGEVLARRLKKKEDM